ncbi:MAG: phage tail sheath subtilisin-like domain-containing protein [Sulfitobacter sp.]
MTYHHGPEVIEHKDGVSVVRDVKSAVTYLNGTAPIGLVHATAEERAAHINKRIVVRTREQGFAAFGPQTDGFNIPQALDALFDHSSGGTIIVNNVFDPDTHASVGDVTAAELTGVIDANGLATGMTGAQNCYGQLGYFPKLLLSAQSSNPGIRTAMDAMAHKLNAMAICDLPVGLTLQQAVEARGTGGVVNANTSSARTILTYPHVKVADTVTGDERLEPLSQRLAGLMIQTDLEQGYHHSASNRELAGVIGTEVDINFYPSDYANDTNMLNEVGIVTCMRSFATGFRAFGARSAAYPTSSHVENFIHARRILDQLHEAITFFSMQYVDRLGTPQNVEALEEAVNGFLRAKIGEGVLYGGTYRFDRVKNTVQEIADGRFHYTLECHPTSLMERLTTGSYVDTKFIAGALALAA